MGIGHQIHMPATALDALVQFDVLVACEPLVIHAIALKDLTGPASEGHRIHLLHSVDAYAVNRDLRFVLSETFRGVQYMPSLAPVLVQFSQQSWGGFQEKLFCYFHDKRIDICAFRKGRVRFCNSFDATLAPDAAYYILNVWQTLAMKRTDILCLSGNIAGLEQLVKELGRFIKNIKHVH